MKTKRINYITKTAIIAALYAALTLTLYPISYGPMQFRISEMLCVLPFFLPEAIPGLFIGYILANLLTPNFLIADVVFGSIATLLAAYFTKKCNKLSFGKFIAPIPPIISNAGIVGAVITFSTVQSGEVFLPMFITNFCLLFVSETAVLYTFGLALLFAYEKRLKNKTTFKGEEK